VNDVWVVVLTAAMTITSIAIAAGVLWWHQRKVAAEAARWGQQLVMAQDAERSRIANDLHDDVVQRLSIALSHLDSHVPEGRETAIPILRGVADDVRKIAHGLHPIVISRLGLIGALTDMVDDCQVPGGPTVMLEVHGVLPPLPALTELALFRVSQEAVQNAMRHSRSAKIVVAVRGLRTGVTVSIRDDGSGLGDRGLAVRGFGFRSMEERMRSVRGRLHVETHPGMGTTIRAEVAVS
jgi:two-component system sensor histidine kinase UhpB